MEHIVSPRGQARPMPDAGGRREPTAPECGGLPMLGGRGDPVSDCVGDMGVAVWIALGRAHQGGVTNLTGQWRDCGHPVPGYLAGALDRLTSSGQLALADPDPQSGGARPVTVTDTGRARYVTLCQGTPRPAGRPVIGSTQAAGRALGELFLANADRGNDAANDHLVTELVRRIRAQQDSRDGGRGQQPPSQPTGTTAAERPPRTVPTPGGQA